MKTSTVNSFLKSRKEGMIHINWML